MSYFKKLTQSRQDNVVSEEGIIDDIRNFFTGKKDHQLNDIKVNLPKTFKEGVAVRYSWTKKWMYPFFDVVNGADPILTLAKQIDKIEQLRILTKDIDKFISDNASALRNEAKRLQQVWNKCKKEDPDGDFDEAFDEAEYALEPYVKRGKVLEGKLDSLNLWKSFFHNTNDATSGEGKLHTANQYREAMEKIIAYRNKYGKEILRWVDKLLKNPNPNHHITQLHATNLFESCQYVKTVS